MLDLILVVLGLWWFCKTEYFTEWSKIMIGGDQFSISLTALVVICYLILGVVSWVKWRYFERHHNFERYHMFF